MRISDWSSDVCSSDLTGRPARSARQGFVDRHSGLEGAAQPIQQGLGKGPADQLEADRHAAAHEAGRHRHRRQGEVVDRSEEHTSELQSLMRISYAVFCLKKNISNPLTQNTTSYQQLL